MDITYPRNSTNYSDSHSSSETMISKNINYISLLLIYTLLFLIIFPNSIFAASLKLVPRQTTTNLHLSLKVDKVEKLAGLKISLTYPDKILKFESAKKSKATSSFMHVVNDKNPGKLIIVMASAKGISGSGITLFDLDFGFAAPSKNEPSVSITITNCQLMTEDLKELSCDPLPFRLLPVFLLRKTEDLQD